ncbi:MAG: bifunctional oligoribonuclease/PAP phosphatase NrnA [Deltaproteobacteria bacterium]|nr:bifunctional oligoribonuclease/PAP phosphatase NrnA [Deltaproteobacteria bacterium]
MIVPDAGDARLDEAEVGRVLDLLRDASTVVLTTHEGPDADGLGAEVALARALRRLGKRVRILNADPTVNRFRFLDRDADFVIFKPEHAEAVRDADVAVLVDTSEHRRVGAVGAAFAARTGPTVCIDHHPRTRESIHGIVAAHLSSTGELMVHLLRRLGATLDADLANPLYAAVLFDTDQFRFVRNDPGPFRIAAELVTAGADAEGIARHMFGTVAKDAMVLLGRVMQAAHFEEGGRLAWASITGETLAGLKVDRDEVRGSVMTLARIEGVQVAVVFKQFETGRTIKVSMRSRGSVEVGDLAQALGGGGHKYAAGADVDGVMEAVTGRVLPVLRERLLNAVD